MAINGKREGFTLEDLRACAAVADLNPRRVPALFDRVRDAVAQWPSVAQDVGVNAAWIDSIGQTLRLELPRS
jgi:serine/threonine-protein kinase HipA